jgi:hypothetical protein
LSRVGICCNTNCCKYESINAGTDKYAVIYNTKYDNSVFDNNNNNGTVAAYLKSYQNYYYKEYHEGILEIAKTFFNNRLHQLVDKTMVAAEKGE